MDGCCQAHWEQLMIKCLAQGHNPRLRLCGILTANPLFIGQPVAPTKDNSNSFRTDNTSEIFKNAFKEGDYCLKCSEGKNVRIYWLPTDNSVFYNSYNKRESNGTPPPKITFGNCR